MMSLGYFCYPVFGLSYSWCLSTDCDSQDGDSESYNSAWQAECWVGFADSFSWKN